MSASNRWQGWGDAMWWAIFAARSTGRRYRVFRRTFASGRSEWVTEPVDGWTP